jgi:LacI family transcriptional regulator
LVESSRLKALLSWRPAGLVLMPCSAVLPSDLPGITDSMPTVLVDRIDASDAIADTVTIDNFEAGQIAANHLLQNGHRDIVIAASDLGYAPIRERAEGASRMIASRTGQPPEVIELGSNVAEGSRAFSSRIARSALPGAVFALTDVTTLSVLSALAEHRVLIPENISIVAFDDYAWMAARNTGLTAIRQPVDEIAATAWRRLRLRMDGEGGAKGEPTVLKANLIVRDSVKNLARLRTESPEDQVRAKPAGRSMPGTQTEKAKKLTLSLGASSRNGASHQRTKERRNGGT